MAEMQALLGDEAVALGALHGGLGAAYGYPGTPSTEIMEYLIDAGEARAQWCVNEKTALEAALGASFAGARALVTMKHVGLNVASDPLMNGALLGINGGLVIAVADDPGMHSSQNEQDSRFYAAFALIPCLEPRSQQECYDMARESFGLSERLHVPVMLRLVTRLSHSRAAVLPAPPALPPPGKKAEKRGEWMLLPAHARRNYAALIEKQKAFAEWAEGHRANRALPGSGDTVIVTGGLGGNYFEENLEDLKERPAWFHLATWPLPEEKLRAFCAGKKSVLVIEEGQPFIEEKLRGILRGGGSPEIHGKLDGRVARTGELDPETVRRALGLAPRPNVLLEGGTVEIPPLPGRPPQLCQGCPHRDSYASIKKALEGLDSTAVTADIGCYALGAMAPFEVPETIVCMGASIGMAKGATDSGIARAVAVIGDSTFVHSGITALIDAARENTPMTVAILDNSTVAMTGCQETALPPDRLQAVVLATGVDPAHFLVLETKPALVDENATKLRAEVEHRGLSVVIFRRECLEAARKRRRQAEKAGALPE